MQFKAKVKDLSHKGLGVVEHPDGMIYFVRGVWPGDYGRFEEITSTKHYGEARLVELLRSSVDRVEPLCPHQGTGINKCGGCPWMIADYASQLAAKQKRVGDTLSRFGVISETERSNIIEEIWKAADALGYRNRAQLKTDGKVVGFVSEGPKQIVPIDDCPILTRRAGEMLSWLIKQLPNDQWRPPENKVWNFIEIDEQSDPSTIVLNKRQSFKQPNDVANDLMRKWLTSKLDGLNKDCSVMELFAGSGNFTEVLAQAGFNKVLAIEAVESSVHMLKEAKLPGVSVLKMDLFRPKLWKKIHRSFWDAKVVFLDPPRDGFKNFAQFLGKCRQLEYILYISCNLDTFARDALKIGNLGFKIKEVVPLDQCPHTPHIEILSVFTRSEIK